MALELAKNKPCPLCNLNIFQWIIIQLCAKFNNKPYRMKFSGVMALEFTQILKMSTLSAQ